MTDEKLKPCPFCGGKAEIAQHGTARHSTVYECTDCGCRLETGEVFDIGAAWNRRSQGWRQVIVDRIEHHEHEAAMAEAADAANISSLHDAISKELQHVLVLITLGLACDAGHHKEQPMTIDKAELVKLIDERMHLVVTHGNDWHLYKTCRNYITQQSQGRDEVLEEAAQWHDAQAAAHQHVHDTDEQPWDEENGAEFYATLHRTYAADIRKLKSPSPAPVERRSEVETAQPVPPTADDLLWEARGGEVADFIASAFANEEGNYPCRNWIIAQWRNFAKQYDATPTAQPEPQGLEQCQDEGCPHHGKAHTCISTVQQRHPLMLWFTDDGQSDMNAWASSAADPDVVETRLTICGLVQQLCRRAAITGGK